MIAGGVPFRDFPVQYGIGPTLLISAMSNGDLWFGTYLGTVLANALYLLAMVAFSSLALRALRAVAARHASNGLRCFRVDCA
jgi:hypothetical protein